MHIGKDYPEKLTPAEESEIKRMADFEAQKILAAKSKSKQLNAPDIKKSSEIKAKEDVLVDKMEQFLNAHSDQNLLNLADFLKQNAHEIETGGSTLRSDWERLKRVNKAVSVKNNIWDKLMAQLVEKNMPGYEFKSETSRFDPITGKIEKYFEKEIKSNIFTDPIKVIAKRMITSNEEFDLFDLKIYLSAHFDIQYTSISRDQ